MVHRSCCVLAFIGSLERASTATTPTLKCMGPLKRATTAAQAPTPDAKHAVRQQPQDDGQQMAAALL